MKTTPLLLSLLLAVYVPTSRVSSFYVPGVTPMNFKTGDLVEAKAVKLTSTMTQLPFDYYSLPFCRPDGDLQYKSENLGEMLRGDRIVNTAFKLQMNVQYNSRTLCTSEGKPMTLTVDQSDLLIQRIKEEYRVHLLVDNLPSVEFSPQGSLERGQLQLGYPLGIVSNDRVFINNCLTFVIHINQVADDTYRIVQFEVKSRSADPIVKGSSCNLDSNTPMMEIKQGTENKLHWCYEVIWRRSDLQWAHRWDNLLAVKDANIHWISISNSTLTLLILTAFLCVIIFRVVRKDIANYNRMQDADEALEETGWKLIHGDVFRPPPRPTLLVVLVGSGAQLCGTLFCTIVVAMLGVSPSSRGALLLVSLFCYCFMGILAGYFAGRLYKTFRLKQWAKTAFQTAFLFPAVLFVPGFIVNMMVWSEQSSRAVSVSSICSLLAMLVFIDLPAVVVSFRFGFCQQPYSNPVRTNQIPRQVPDQPLHVNLLLGIVIAGLLPFLAIFLELNSIFTAVWHNQFYYVFGFLFIVFVIMLLLSCILAILNVYFTLTTENYHWWWRSFIIGGSSTVYVLVYTLYYYLTKVNIVGFVPTVLYFGYALFISFSLWLLTGTAGFFAAFLFVRKIYDAVKID